MPDTETSKAAAGTQVYIRKTTRKIAVDLCDRDHRSMPDFMATLFAQLQRLEPLADADRRTIEGQLGILIDKALEDAKHP